MPALARRDPDTVPAVIDQYDSPLVAAAIDAIEDAAGGRQALLAGMIAAEPTEEIAYLVGLLAHPSHDTRKLSALCKAGGVSLGAVLHAFKSGALARMVVDVTAKIVQHTPGVVEDVLVRAQPHQVACGNCYGTGAVEKADPSTGKLGSVECKVCRGVGEVVQLPDLDRQKLALDLAQVLPKKAPMVAVDNRSVTLGDASVGGMAKLLAATDAILHGHRPTHASRQTGHEPTPTDSSDTGADPIDAEVLPPLVENPTSGYPPPGDGAGAVDAQDGGAHARG